MFWAWWIPIVIVVFVLTASVAYRWRPRRAVATQASPLVQAKRRFHAQRERLEARFLQLTTAHSNPDAPRWADCTFADDVAYVRNRTTGELSAFVAVSIGTEEFHAGLGRFWGLYSRLVFPYVRPFDATSRFKHAGHGLIGE